MFFGGMGGFGGGMDLLRLASDPAVQKKIGIEDKKDALEKLATEIREARPPRGDRPDFRNMTADERTKFMEKMRADREKMQADREKTQKANDEKVKGLLGAAKYNQLVEIQAGLTLTRTGPTAVLDPSIAAILKLTDGQKAEIKKVIDELNAARTKLFEGLRGQRGGARGGAAVQGPQVILVAGAPGGGQRPDMTKIRAQMDELRKKANGAISKILTAEQKLKIKALMKGVEGLELQRRGRGGPGGAQGGGQRGGGQGGQGGRRPGGGGPDA